MIDTKRFVATLLVAATLAATLSGANEASSQDTIVIKAGTVFIGNGQSITDGMVVIRDGRIVAVGRALAVPQGAEVITTDGSITPGLIDANAMLEPVDVVTQPDRRRGVMSYMFESHDLHGDGQACTMCDGSTFLACALAEVHDDLEPGQPCPVCGGTADGEEIGPFASGVVTGSRTEASSEVVPHTFVIDSIDLRSPDFDRLLRGGVTTVFASPDSSAVIGPRGAVVRTGGPLARRVLRDAGDVQATIGSDPYRVGSRNGTPSRFRATTVRTRRPNSRMGVAWVFRKAFYDAEHQADGVEVGGADLAPPDALEAVTEIRDGDIGLRVQARTQRDMFTAMRLADEFDLSFTLLEATEAYRCLPELKAREWPVIFGPIYIEPSGATRRSGEGQDSRLTTLRGLLDAGIPTALSAQDLREEDGLARQAMYAIRAGLSLDEALACVTSTPAHLLGLDEELGTLEPGKRADVVIWSGEPFAATSRMSGVMIDGRMVYQEQE